MRDSINADRRLTAKPRARHRWRAPRPPARRQQPVPRSDAVSRGGSSVELLAAIDSDFLDAARIGIEYLELKPAGTRHQFAAHRHAPDAFDDIAAERIDVLTGFADVEFRTDRGHDFFQIGAAIGEIGTVILPDDGMDARLVVLVLDVADDLLDDVLDRDQPVGAAVFVDHQREVNARRLHLRQQIDRRHRRRHIDQRAHDLDRRQRQRQIDRLEIETGDRRLAPRRLRRGAAAFLVMKAIRSRMCTMPTGSSSVSP